MISAPWLKTISNVTSFASDSTTTGHARGKYWSLSSLSTTTSSCPPKGVFRWHPSTLTNGLDLGKNPFLQPSNHIFNKLNVGSTSNVLMFNCIPFYVFNSQFPSPICPGPSNTNNLIHSNVILNVRNCHP